MKVLTRARTRAGAALGATLMATGALTALGGTAYAAPPAPTVTGVGTNGNGPSADIWRDPTFHGIAQTGSLVKLYGDAACSGPVLGQAQLPGGGPVAWAITITVAEGSTTTGYATATDAGGTSPCSTTSATFSSPVRPGTKLTQKPPKVTTYNPESQIDGATVKVRWKATGPGNHLYSCTLDKKPISCSGKKIFLTLKAGTYKFTVAARDEKFSTCIDMTPAKAKFKVKIKK